MGISKALAEQAYVHSLAASNMVFSGLAPSGGAGGAVAAGPDAGAPAAAAEPVKEKEAFDLKLKVVDAKAKIKVIKEIRVITGLGLKEVM
jgi:ribosomal protein L7/L12